MSESRVILAAISGAHGIGGEVRLKLFAESAESLSSHKTVRVGERELTLKSVKSGGGAPIARFAEVADRTAAEALRGELVTVARSALPILEEGEGEALGTVVAVENFGAGDILEIEKPGGKTAMVPFRAGIADLVEGRIVLDPAFLA
jgi:16S rRNA processing protein RimM